MSVASKRCHESTRWELLHEDNADTMGGMAGRAMTGQAVLYDHLPAFYSDLFDLVHEAVDAARRLIAEPGPLKAADLKGRLPV